MFYYLLEKIKISGIWLYNSGYLITQQEQTVKIGCLMVQKNWQERKHGLENIL